MLHYRALLSYTFLPEKPMFLFAPPTLLLLPFHCLAHPYPSPLVNFSILDDPSKLTSSRKFSQILSAHAVCIPSLTQHSDHTVLNLPACLSPPLTRRNQARTVLTSFHLLHGENYLAHNRYSLVFFQQTYFQ